MLYSSYTTATPHYSFCFKMSYRMPCRHFKPFEVHDAKSEQDCLITLWIIKQNNNNRKNTLDNFGHHAETLK